MTNNPTDNGKAVMTDKEMIELLAEFMGWDSADKMPWTGKHFWVSSVSKHMDIRKWNPIKNWNHWRQVELKIMEDVDLSFKYHVELNKVWHPSIEEMTTSDGRMKPPPLMAADLKTRCKALCTILNSEDE